MNHQRCLVRAGEGGRWGRRSRGCYWLHRQQNPSPVREKVRLSFSSGGRKHLDVGSSNGGRSSNVVLLMKSDRSPSNTPRSWLITTAITSIHSTPVRGAEPAKFVGCRDECCIQTADTTEGLDVFGGVFVQPEAQHSYQGLTRPPGILQTRQEQHYVEYRSTN